MNLNEIADNIVDAFLNDYLFPRYRAEKVINVLDELEPIKQAFAKQNHEICQILGKALGYGEYLEPELSRVKPGTLCVGLHTAETIAAEAARRIEKLHKDTASMGVRATLNETAAIAASAEVKKLQQFKDFVHKWLDDNGVPHDPAKTGEAGCRVEGRLEWLKTKLNPDDFPIH